MSRLIISCVFVTLLGVELSRADTISIGPDGINATAIPFLTGSGVNIGQVELFRPGKPDCSS